MFANMLPALRMLVVLSVLTGVAYPLLVTGVAQLAFPWRANGSLLIERPEGRRVRADRAAVLRSEVLLEPPFGDRAAALQCGRVVRLEPRRAQSRARRSGRRPDQGAPRGRPRGDRTRAGGSCHDLRQRPRSAHQRGRGRVSDRTGRQGPRPRRRRSSRAHRAAHRATDVRRSGREEGERPAAQPRSGPSGAKGVVWAEQPCIDPCPEE